MCLQKAGVRVGSDQVVVMELLMFGEARFGVGEEEEEVACS